MLTATAAEIVVTDQPNSARTGSMSTPGTARNAAAPTSARKVTAATHQAGRIRWARGAARTVTAEVWRMPPPPEQWPDSHAVQGSGHGRRAHPARRRRPRPAPDD